MTDDRCRWFVWIGQHLAHCDRCDRPAWEHDGYERFPDGAGPFYDGPMGHERWGVRAKQAMRERWEATA